MMICNNCKEEYDPVKMNFQLVITRNGQEELLEFDTQYCLIDYIEEKYPLLLLKQMIRKEKLKELLI